MIIDAFTHVLPKKYYELLLKKSAGKGFYIADSLAGTPTLTDIKARLEMMDEYKVDMEVITLASPPPEVVCPDHAAQLIRVANVGLAEIVDLYRGRFIGVGAVVQNEPEAALQGIEQIKELGLKGVLLYTSSEGKPLDHPSFRQVFRELEKNNLPVWLHPLRPETRPDYQAEEKSEYLLFQVLGWPFESSLAQGRLIFGGVFEDCPGLKVVIHHGGAMVPFFADRINHMYLSWEKRANRNYRERLRKPILDYYKNFYVDTAVTGSVAAARCMLDFYGPDQILFGTDAPFDAELGRFSKRVNLDMMRELKLTSEVQDKIFAGNVRTLLSL